MNNTSLECFAAVRQSASDLNRSLAHFTAQLDDVQRNSPVPDSLDTWHLSLSATERAALIDLQFTGSALAMAYRYQCPRPLLELYEQWADALDIVQTALWKPLRMGDYLEEKSRAPEEKTQEEVQEATCQT